MPQQIGQFTIVSTLAQTAAGAVYKASDPKGRTVALRTLRLDVPGAAEVVARFRAAAKAASALGSPNIAGIYGGGEAAGVFFIAVEFVEGVKLSSNLARGEAASMSEVLDLSRQVCYALDHAHTKSIAHPEMKPTNIILEWDGTAKIMDFGVPRVHPAEELSEATYYLSPEEIRGEPLTLRSNLFSWAAIAYQMATGRRPFEGEDAATVRKKILEETPTAPHELNAKLTARASEVLLKALAKEPAERYASGAEFMAALETYNKVEAAKPEPAPAKSAAKAAAAPTGAPKPVIPAAAAVASGPAKTAPSAAPAAKPASVVAPPAAKPSATSGAAPQRAAPPARPAPAVKPAAAAGSKNMLLYGMGGVIVLLLTVVGVLWMRSGSTSSPSGGGAPASAAAGPAAATPAVAATPAGTQAGATRTARQRQQAPAPAPVATAAPTGGLAIDSSPQGADVQIDGRHEASWVTPFTATGLNAGGHSVSFTKAGYMATSRTAQVTAGQNPAVAVQLAEMAATLAVSSEPAGAAILVDGKDSGKVTPAQLVVAKGSHTVTVQKAGFLPVSNTLEVAPGQSAQFAPSLKPTGNTENIKTVGKLGGIFGGGGGENTGRVSVRTNPKGAQVLVNGSAVKKTTPVDFYLEPGSYELTVMMPGYKPVKKVVDVQKGGKLVLDETLAK